MPHLEETIRLEGRYLAQRGIKGQLRAAVYCARMMDLLPPAGKGEKGAESIRLLSQIEAFSPEERKRMAKEFNIACLRTFVDVLDNVAWKLWREKSEISVESLRAGLMDKEIIDVEGSYDRFSGAALFQKVWKFQKKAERNKVRVYAELKARTFSCDAILKA